MILVECQRIDCGATVDIGAETYWQELRGLMDPFRHTDGERGPTIAIELPEGWIVDHTASGDNVIHCPEHAL